MSEDIAIGTGRGKPQLAQLMTGVSKADDCDKRLKTLHLEFMNDPGVYSASCASGSEIRISVKDQGRGISADELPFIFGAFH